MIGVETNAIPPKLDEIEQCAGQIARRIRVLDDLGIALSALKFRSVSSLAQQPRRIADYNCARLDVFRHNASCSHDGARADAHSRPDKGVSTDPGVALDNDRWLEQRHTWITIVVRTRAQVRPLRDSHTLGKSDGAERVKDRAVADRRLIPNR